MNPGAMTWLLSILYMALFAPLPGRNAAHAGWDKTAERVVQDVSDSVHAREARVTYIDDDGQRIYFAGLSPTEAETGLAVIFYGKAQNGDADWAELGAGIIEASQPPLTWASVDSLISRRIRKDDLVRLDPLLGGISLGPIWLESPGETPRVHSVCAIFETLLSHLLDRKGIKHVWAPSTGQWPDTSAVLKDAAVMDARGARMPFALAGAIRRSGADLSVRMALYHVPTGVARFEQEYPLDAIAGWDPDLERLKWQSSAVTPAAEAPEDTHSVPPPGLLRLSLATSPTGQDGRLGWPPRTPADGLLARAISVTLPEISVAYRLEGDHTHWFILPAELRDMPGAVNANRIAALLNDRRTDTTAKFLLPDFRFSAHSETELVLECGAPFVEVPAILSDPAFRLLDPAGADPDMGLGRWRIHSGTLSEIILARRPPRPWLKAAEDRPETIVLSIDTDPRVRQARFELGETDLHELTDADFLKYTGAVAYLNRIVQSRLPALHVLLFNLSAAPMSDAKFRQAVDLALDRRATLEVLLNNRGTVAPEFLPAPIGWTGGGAHSRAYVQKTTAAARERAKDFRRPIRLALLTPEEDPVFSIIAERIQADLRAISVAVQIQRVPWAEYDRRLAGRQFDLALAAFFPTEPAGLWLSRRFAEDGPENYCGYRNSTFDALVSIRAAPQVAQDWLMQERPALPMFWVYRHAVLGKRVRSADLKEGPFFSIDGIRLLP
ncbi:MAG: hypothetical protein A3G34_14475 [Candidatus Lindowbacteria bacterium RIFCSPLOWO2_12_FULL_62_27]|nr:MAG: hypothetical protein A3G34_14475 [Candidatus Lindowbacteria bacterium RIFCSPLOWO2_12_FULL_62_27]